MKRTFTILLMICILFSTTALGAESHPPLRLGGTITETDYWKENGIPTARPSYGWDDYMTMVQGDNVN